MLYTYRLVIELMLELCVAMFYGKIFCIITSNSYTVSWHKTIQFMLSG